MTEYCKEIPLTLISPCASDPDKLRVRAELSVGVGDLLPYLNAILPGAIYNPSLPALTITRGSRLLTVYPDHLMLDRAKNSTDAREVLDWVRDRINEAYDRRDEIVPRHKPRRRPTAVQLFAKLPGTNCGRCGQATCLAFAAGLSVGQCSPADCSELSGETRAELEQLLDA